jgi:hypothetical protein
VSPESSVASPVPNSAEPIPQPTSSTVPLAATQNTHAETYLTTSSRNRPAGATSR